MNKIVKSIFYLHSVVSLDNLTWEEIVKKEKEVRRLKHELTTEKEKFNQMVAKNQSDIQNLQATLYEESQARLKLSMELDTKESEVENLQTKITHLNVDAESISSGTFLLPSFKSLLKHRSDQKRLLSGTDVDIGDPEASLEGWLQTPLKQNIRRQVMNHIIIVLNN